MGLRVGGAYRPGAGLASRAPKSREAGPEMEIFSDEAANRGWPILRTSTD